MTDLESSGTVFELSGGALCLDFANTWGSRRRPEKDRLRTYGDLVAFAVQTGELTPAEAERFGERAARRPAEADAALGRARELREAIYRIFATVAAGGEVADGDLARLNAALPGALSRLRVAPRPGAERAFDWRWAGSGADLAGLLAPILHSAAELLTSDDSRRVRECASDTCNWLFLDRSRNRSRRWCDMQSCGNRAKARRHYRRVKAAKGG